MQGYLCPYCDAALTRAALLAHRLQKLAFAAHRDLKHAGDDWQRCELEPCSESARVLATAGLTNRSSR